MTTRVRVTIGDPEKPEECRVFDNYSHRTIPFPEALEIERKYGGSFGEFVAGVDANHLRALQVLVWSLLRRDDPDLRLDEVTMPIRFVTLDTVCSECNEVLELAIWDKQTNTPATKETPDARKHVVGVHANGLLTCEPPKEADPLLRPTETAPAGPRKRKAPASKSESQASTSEPSPSSSESDPGSGAS